MKSEEKKELNRVLKKRPRRYVHSDLFSRRSDGHQQRNTSVCDVVAMQQDTSVQEKEKDLHCDLVSGDRRMIAIRTPLQQRTQHCEEEPRKCRTGRTKKTRIRSSQQRLLQDLSPAHE